jgi:hypothetical protein
VAFLNGEKYTVIGVMPPTFQFLDSKVGCGSRLLSRPNNWLRGSLPDDRRAHETRGLFEQADSEVRTIHKRIAHDNPETGPSWLDMRCRSGIRIARRRATAPVRSARRRWFVLLIACANIANLLLSRGRTRREMLCAASAPVARASFRHLLDRKFTARHRRRSHGFGAGFHEFPFAEADTRRSRSGQSSQVGSAGPGFTVLVTLLTAVIFWLWRFSSSRVDLNDALKQGGRSG